LDGKCEVPGQHKDACDPEWSGTPAAELSASTGRGPIS